VTHELDIEEYREKAALYALGSLSQHEARVFEQHLAEGCSVCAAQVAHFDEVTAALGLAGPSAEPSPYLRDLLLARIQREKQSTTPVRDSSPRPAAEVIPFSSLSRPERSGLRTAAPWAVAAAVVVVGVVTFWAWRQSARDAGQLRDQVAALRRETAQLQAEVARERDKVYEANQINAVLSSPQHRLITLEGQAPAPSSSAKVYWDLDGGRWVVSANLPPPPPGKVYQLWFVTADAKISAGLIKPDQAGQGFGVFEVPASLGRLAAAAITLEPEGGSAQPTMPIYALGSAG
jgi:anti-sigma-K factor RskA